MLVVAAALYAAWLIGPLVNPDLHPGAGAASELAARDQPWGRLFRATDVLCGLLVLAVAVTELRLRRTPWVWGAAALFAVSTVADAGLAPLPCAPSIDDACPAGVPASHLITSLGALAGAFASMVALAVAARRTATGWAAAALGGYTAVLFWADGGWTQRAELLGISAWLCLLATVTQRHSRGREPT